MPKQEEPYSEFVLYDEEQLLNQAIEESIKEANENSESL